MGFFFKLIKGLSEVQILVVQLGHLIVDFSLLLDFMSHPLVNLVFFAESFMKFLFQQNVIRRLIFSAKTLDCLPIAA